MGKISEDPEKPPGLPRKKPLLWVLLFLFLAAAIGPSPEVWIAAIVAVVVFGLLAIVLPRKKLERLFQIIVLTAIFGSCASLALSAGIYGSAIYGSRKGGGYYLDKSGRYNPGPHYVGVGPLVYYTVYWVESATVVSLSLLFSVGFSLYPDDKQGKEGKGK